MTDAERGATDAERALSALLALMARLRDPESGCPWDREQTFATIAPYTIEEAYEVADAIARDDRAQLRDELGDLLFQVVFHARLAEERGWFDFAAVADAIHAKLVRRHPHVFEGAAVEPAQLVHEWEAQKARERAARAAKLGRRAARVGFDWPDAAGVRAKIAEELREVEAALTASGGAAGGAAGDAAGDAAAEELGDLLFAIVNWGRHLHIDAESALRAANDKFERRFRSMERLARERGLTLERLSAQEWEGLWQEAKLNPA
jgi:nucleoside triphosphate diphosphatase